MGALVFALSVVGCGKSNDAGVEGKWFETDYKDSDGEPTSVKIKVVGSYHFPDDVQQVAVYWRVTHTGKTETSYGWKNKVLIDEEGRQFTAKSGIGSKKLQPTEESAELKSLYKLPKGIDTSKLYWGLAYKGEVHYKIRLNKPREFESCAMMGRFFSPLQEEYCRAGKLNEEVVACFVEEGMTMYSLQKCMPLAKGDAATLLLEGVDLGL